MEKRTQQGKLTNLEIASFCSEMAMILKSGISSLEGVDLLREDAQTKAEKELLDEIYQSVSDGYGQAGSGAGRDESISGVSDPYDADRRKDRNFR